uniref:N2,N2-dimethylguanosine tRNA methyltransferase family protein n=1 Tax=Arundo donax TaxID=35708 RepID=A0A0A9GFR2_ARUDO
MFHFVWLFDVTYSSYSSVPHVLPCAWQQRSLIQQWTYLCCEPAQD